jgi:hypothetical protein
MGGLVSRLMNGLTCSEDTYQPDLNLITTKNILNEKISFFHISPCWVKIRLHTENVNCCGLHSASMFTQM